MQTQTYSTGSFDRYAGPSNGYILDLILTEQSQDPAANTSCVSYKLQLRSGPSNRFDWELTARLHLGGAQVAAATAEHYLDYNDTWVLLEGTCTVPHNADGTLDLAFAAAVIPWNGGTQYTPPEMTLSGTMALHSIPRASTIAATGAYIEDTATIVVARRDPGYTYSLRYAFGSLTGYLADAAGRLSDQQVQLDAATILFPIPAEFYGQIPDAPSGVCTLTCTTYAGATQIGQPQTAVFTVTADPARCAPALQGTVEDGNAETLALTQNPKTLVPGWSIALCRAEAAAKNGAAITSLTLNGMEISGDVTLPDVTAGVFTFRATDSRGYWSEYTVPDLTVIPYASPSCTARAARTDPTSGDATLTLTGKWSAVSFGGSDNALTCRYRVNGGAWTAVPVTVDGENFTVQAALSGLDYRQTHTIDIHLSDQLQTVAKSVTVSKGVPVFDWGEGDFAFHVPVRFTATDGTVFTLDLSGGNLTAIIL